MEIDGNTLLIIIIVLFLFFSTPGGDGVSSQYEFNQLETFKKQLSAEYESFERMNYNSGFRNITGFKLSLNDVIDDPQRNATYPIPSKDYEHWFQNQDYLMLPQDVTSRIKNEVWSPDMDDPEENIFPPNITSSLLGRIQLVSNNKHPSIPMPIPRFYEGPTEFSDVTPPMGESYPEEWPVNSELHNVTFDTGQLTIHLTHVDKVASKLGSERKNFFNSQTDRWKFLNLRISLSDKGEHEKHLLHTNAIYDVRRGRILAMSESAKFHSRFAFPHYMNLQDGRESDDKEMFESLKKAIEEYWKTSNFVKTLTMGDLQDWYDESVLKCEYMVFLQLSPWNQYTRDQIKMIDDELNWPLGRPANLSHLPPVTISKGILYSPDCGVELAFQDAKGERYELKIRSIRTHLLFGIGLFIGQIYLLLCQMHHTNTPSSVNKISVYCFSMINLVDGSLATIYFFAANFLPELYLPLVTSAFACFILASVFETRYLISVYASQLNERNIGITTLLRGGHPNNEEGGTGTGTTVVPDESSISGSLYARFFFMLVTFTVLALSAMSWPRKLRMIFEYSVIIVLNSYWLPQIFRNAIKGTLPRRNRLRDQRANEAMGVRRQNKMPLLWKFVLGTTLIRTLPVVYVFTYSSNVFRHHRNVRFVVVLCLWLLFQIAMLYSQDILGSRWFLPKMSIPEGYSYHKAMPAQDLLEHGSTAKYTIDCAICMSEVPVRVEEVVETHKVDEQTYMVTPCNHIFHTHCLENWMSYKLQCPVCRSQLPPL